MYLHAKDVLMLEYGEFLMVEVFLFDHLCHFLELLLVSLRHIGSDAFDKSSRTEEALVDFWSLGNVLSL